MKKPIHFGKYLLLDRINVGGMAEVFKAKAFGVEGFERFVAVKRILPNIAEDEEFITMFIDEAKISVQLNHANIAQIFDLGRVEDSYFIALELVQGKDLRAMFDTCRNKPQLNAGATSMPIAQACFVVMKTCEGLDYAHNKRDAMGRELTLVHRDVSPQNILISYEGEVKLIDFGIAKAAGKASKTQQGILKGKFGYMSPEQVRGLPLDRRSDVFSVGILLYELLTGERLFVGESDFSTLEKVRNVEILPPSTYNRKINDELERIVMKALAKDVDDRYQNAIDVHDDLQAYMYSAGEFYSRKDLAAWMKKVYASDIEAEVAKLESYRALTVPAPAGALPVTPPPPPRRSSSSQMAALPSSPSLLPSPPAAGARPSAAAQVTAGARPSHAAAGQASAKSKNGSDPDIEWDDEELATNIYDQPEDAADSIVDEHLVSPGRAAALAPLEPLAEEPTRANPQAHLDEEPEAPAEPDEDDLGPHLARVPLAADGAPVLHSSVRPSGSMPVVSGTHRPSSPSMPAMSASAQPAPLEDPPSGPTPFAAAMNLNIGPVVTSPKTTPVAKTVQMDAPVLDLPKPFGNNGGARGNNGGPAVNGGSKAPKRDAKRDQMGDLLGEDTGESPLPPVQTRPSAALPTLVVEPRGGSRRLFIGLVGGGLTFLVAALLGVFYMISSKPGEVLVTSEPSAGVQVLVNSKRVQDSHGVPVEGTPLPLTLSPGSYQLTVQLPGYLPFSEQVVVKSGDKLLRRIVLEPLAATAGFTLTSTPSGAEVTLDGKLIEKPTPLKVEALLPGTHHLVVSSAAGKWEADVNFEAGKMLPLNATLSGKPDDKMAAAAPHTEVAASEPAANGTNDVKPKVESLPTVKAPDSKPVVAEAIEAKPEPKPVVAEAKPVVAEAKPEPKVEAAKPAVELKATKPEPKSTEPKATEVAVAKPEPKAHKPEHVEPDSRPQPLEAKVDKPTPVEAKPERAEKVEKPVVEKHPAAASLADGYLRLGSKPWTNIAVDGKDTGMHTPQTKLKLAAGTHRVTLTNPEFNVRESFSVDIKPGETQTVIKDLQTPATAAGSDD